ncbi:MAG: TonB-dependent receptor [Pseudomonadota bacterium]
MTHNSEIARAVRRALFMGACVTGGITSALAQDQAAENSDVVDTVVVTGSRIVSPNLQSISPVTSMSAEDVARTGRSSIEDVINELPQVFSAQGANLSNGSNGTATVNLRGLGSNRTLVLINGRRLGPGDPGSSGTSTGFAADINMVPTALVERVELLTGGASSVYGADAVGGVVNFIINKKFEGVRINGAYSFYNHKNDDSKSQAVVEDATFQLPGGTVNRGYDKSFAFTVGSNFADDRGNATFYATYRDTDPVLQSSYDYSSCTFNSGDEFGCGGSSTSYPVRFRSVDPNDPLHPYVENYTYNAANTFGAGTPAPYNYGPLNYYQRPNQRYTAGTFLNFQLNESAEVYGEFMFLKDESNSQIAPSGIFLQKYTVSCANPLWGAAEFAAFCGDFGLTTADDTQIEFRRRNVEGGGRAQELNHAAYRGGIGVKGELSEAWTYDASLFQGTSRISNTYNNDFSISRTGRALDVITDPNTGQPACRSAVLGTDPLCIPYNVYTPGAIDATQLNYVQIPLISVGEVTERVLQTSFTGDLGKYGLKFGSAEDGVMVNIGAEYREVETDFQPDGNFIAGDGAGQGGATLPLAGSYNTKELFFEARIPIAKSLSAEAGYRFSDYSGGFEATTNTYKAGLEWSPVDSVRLRGSFQHAVRVPNIYELFATRQVALDGTIDPCTGDDPGLTPEQCANTGVTALQYGNLEANPAAQYNGFIGGNADLKPEQADTISFGIELQPSFAPGLRVNLDWYSITIDDPIQQPNADLTVLTCALSADPVACGKVNRDPQGSLWESTGGFVADTLENLGQIETSGIDVDLSYGFDIGAAGRLKLSMVGTYLDKYTTTLAAGFSYDCVGLYGGICTSGTPNGAPVAQWRHKADVTWTSPWSGFDLSLGWRYYGESKRDIEFSPDLALFGELSTGPLPTDQVLGARNYIDLSASVSLFEKYTLRFGANNLLDKDPPLNGSSTCPTGPCNGNTWPQAYDALGRQVFLTIGAEF